MICVHKASWDPLERQPEDQQTRHATTTMFQTAIIIVSKNATNLCYKRIPKNPDTTGTCQRQFQGRGPWGPTPLLFLHQTEK